MFRLKLAAVLVLWNTNTADFNGNIHDDKGILEDPLDCFIVEHGEENLSTPQAFSMEFTVRDELDAGIDVPQAISMEFTRRDELDVGVEVEHLACKRKKSLMFDDDKEDQDMEARKVIYISIQQNIVLNDR